MLNIVMNFVRYIWNQFRKPTGLGGEFSTMVMNQMNKKQYQAVLDNINVQLSDAILDIGFGNGYLLKKLLKLSPNIFAGIDISQDMVDKVSHTYQKEIKDNQLEISLADVKKLPYKNASFDKIYTVNTLYFWDDVEKSFAEIERVLKSWWIFLNVFYSKEFLNSLRYTNYGFSKYSLKEIQDFTENSWLTVREVIPLSSKAFCIVAEKKL